MPKLFVVSDVHSYFTPLKKALDEKGFDPQDENHWLIVCGDLFDRGAESVDLLHYILDLPRKVVIRGNHEDLFEEMCRRGYPERHDRGNGTFDTLQQLCTSVTNNEVKCAAALEMTRPYFEQLVNYFETENYIFVHGWIPCEKFQGISTKPWWQVNKTFEYNPDWRNCNDVEWESARWINGIERAYEGVIEPNKTIVCGHWHCSYGHSLDSANSDTFRSEFGENAVWDPWYHNGCIAIDRCTAHTGEVNVLVIEDDFLVDL